MGVESVSVAVALSHADTLEITCHSPTRGLLPALESMESKRHTSYRSYSTNVYIQNHWSTALIKLLGKTTRTQIVLSPETQWTLYNYIYLEDNTAYGAKYWWHNGAHNKNQKTSETWNTVRYKQKPSTILSRECNNHLGLGCTTRCQNIWETSKMLKLKNSNLNETSFWSAFLISQKWPTICHHIRKQ